MYLAIDFIISPDSKVYVADVDAGLPWGAHQYHLTHLVHFGKPSDIFRRIEWTSRKIYGKTFKVYIQSLSFNESLKSLERWIAGQGPLPKNIHPGLRLQDRWIQYQLIKRIAPAPEMIPLDVEDLVGTDRFIERKKNVVLKRRVGKDERDWQFISEPSALWKLNLISHHFLLQEHVESKIGGYSLSIRSVVFGGEFMFMIGNLSSAPTSGHGILAFVSSGSPFGLSEKPFQTESFNQKSWESGIWTDESAPHDRSNEIQKELVAKTTLVLHELFIRRIKEISVRIERLYDGLDPSTLPKAYFEE